MQTWIYKKKFEFCKVFFSPLGIFPFDSGRWVSAMSALFDILGQFLDDGKNVPAPFLGDPMGVVHESARVGLQLPDGRQGRIHPLVLPRQEPQCHFFLLFSEKSHALILCDYLGVHDGPRTIGADRFVPIENLFTTSSPP
jgi:hypothetical protein